jgi:hypothetical protein
MTTARIAVALALLLVSSGARGAEGEAAPAPEPEPEPDFHYVLGIGGAFSLETADKRVNPGGNFFFEIEAIAGWLEIEAGVSVVKAAAGGEVSYDLLFKKPFHVRRWMEFMVGVGPEVVQTFGHGTSKTYYGAEGVLDFMFWPSRHFGVWVAPSWDLVVRDRASLAFGTTTGPMVRW